MFRQSVKRLTRSPFEVLGVMSNCTPAEAKAKYQELARIHHPDMPSGNPDKFREIHAAYQLIKSGKAHEEAAKAASSTKYRSETGATAQRYYGKNYTKHQGPNVTAEDIRKMKEEAMRRGEDRGFFGNLSLSQKAALIIIILVVLYCLYRAMVWLQDPYGDKELRSYGFSDDIDGSTQRGRRGGGSRGDQLKYSTIVGEGGGPPEHNAVSAAGDRVESEAAKQARLEKEAALRQQNRMRRYDDLREYFYVNDPDGCASRRCTTQKVMSSFLDVEKIPERCPIVIEVDGTRSDMRSHDAEITSVVEQRLAVGGSGSDSTATGVVGDVHFDRLDAEAVAIHGAVAIGRIPKLSVAQHEWTFIEYKDAGAKKAPSVCLVGIHNRKFKAGEGFAQRIVISGGEDLQSAEARSERRAAIREGLVNPKQYATPNVVPMRLQQMKARQLGEDE